MKYVCDNARHLICVPYSIVGLHAMANNLGIGKHWFHGRSLYPHYDIPKLRIAEVQAKCEVIPTRELLKIIKDAAREKKDR